MRRFSVFLTLLLLAALTAVPGAAQTAAKTPTKKLSRSSGRLADDTINSWNGIARKLIEMAEDFPEDKYDYRPTPEVRSFRQMMLHIAGVNYLLAKAVKGLPVDPAEEDPPVEKFRTRKDVVDFLTKSFAEGAALVQEKGERGLRQQVKHPFAERLVTTHSLWMLGIEHSGEHYGNLVVYYRLNGLVPPVSRPRR